MIKEEILLHDFGSVIACGIRDSVKDNVIFRYFSFWNHGSTSSPHDILWIQPDDTPFFGYFWTSNRRLLKGLKGMVLFGLLQQNNQAFMGKKCGAWHEACEIAEDIFLNIPREPFILIGQDVEPDRYSVKMPKNS